MVRRASQLVKKLQESAGLLLNSWVGAVAKVSGLTMLSRVCGFVRDQSFAYVFGASPWIESFIVAFKLPGMFRRVLGEGMTSVVVPVFSELTDKESQNKFIQSMFLALFAITGLICLIVSMFPVICVKFVAAGFSDDSRLMMTASMLPWCFGYLIFISWLALLSGVLNAHKSFALPAAVPLVLSVGLVIGTWLVYFYEGHPMWLCYSTAFAGVVQVWWMIAAIRQYDFRIQWPHVWHPGVKKVLAMMFAAWLGMAASQISVFMDTWIASWLPEGCITWLYLSERLVYMPQGTIGVAIATVLLPGLSKASVDNDSGSYDSTLAKGLVWGVRLGVPLMMIMVCYAEPIVLILFGYGKFSAHHVHATAQSMAAMVVGLPLMMMNKLLVASYFAKKLVRQSVYATILCVVCNACIALTFMNTYQHVALAAAIASGSAVSVMYLLHRHPSRQYLLNALTEELRSNAFTWFRLFVLLYVASMLFEITYSASFFERVFKLMSMLILSLGATWFFTMRDAAKQES